MSFGGTAFSELSSVMGRKFRAMRTGRQPDDAFDPYEKVPLQRDALASLFEADLRGVAPHAEDNKLRDSERLERDTMSLIRGALYTND